MLSTSKLKGESNLSLCKTVDLQTGVFSEFGHEAGRGGDSVRLLTALCFSCRLAQVQHILRPESILKVGLSHPKGECTKLEVKFN